MNVSGQITHGNVVVHSDPRLSLLLKKPRSTSAPVAGVSMSKVSDVVPRKEGEVLASNMDVKTKSPITLRTKTDAGISEPSKGWTPPVRRKARAVFTSKGFRVQIYSGPDRNKAIEIKTEFMRNYPEVRTYLNYVSPSFRVKIGDYRTRAEALGMLKEAHAKYSTSMIVPDVISVSAF